ncbi:MAG TPA: 6-bladed beta-propeller [Longimicrobiaceae bacterium]|nr:6-bladed beta-propeller [Longimicrobiaceae bacterium]
MEYQNLLPVLLLATAACGADASGKDTAAAAPTWSLSPAPVVSIGEVDGDPDYQLYQATDATVRTDGSIAVVNTGNATVAVYDRQGRFLARIGRKGQGPGEFEVPTWIASLPGDTVVAWDARLRRLSYFDPAGRLARLTTLTDAEGTFPKAVGLLADGSFLVDRGPDMIAMMQGRRGVWRDSSSVQRFGRDGRPVGKVGPFPSDDVYLRDRVGGFGWDDLPFGRRTFLAATRQGLYVGDSGTGEIVVYAPDGTRSRGLRSPHAPWAISESDVARYKEERLERVAASDRRKETEAMLAEAPFPKKSPSFGGMAVDPDGNVWVQEYPRPGQAEVAWTVLGRDGRTVARIQLPRALEVYEVGNDYVLGRRRDDLDVEHVELYSVTRS